MDALVENKRLPRLRSEARIRTNENNNERLQTLVKRPKISPKTLNDLPEEVLLKIYAYLSIRNLVRCSGVSKRIRRVCLDESLWQKINLYGKNVPSEFIEQILANGCKYLNLQDAQINGTLSLPTNTYQLKYLNLSGLIANMENVQQLLLSCSFSIEKLSLSGLHRLELNEEMVNAIFKNENLTVLDLSNCGELTIEFINQVKKCNNLTDLALCHTSRTWSLVNHLVNNLPTSLEKLSFDCLSDGYVKVIVNRCKKLTELDLFGAFDVTKKSITHIAEKLPQLVKLDVQLTGIGIDSIIELKSLSNLKILNCDGYLGYHLTKSQLPNITINTEIGSNLNIAMPLPLMFPEESIKVIDGFWDIVAKPIDLFSWSNAATGRSFSWEEKLRKLM